MKCKRCEKRDGTLCDACIHARQKAMKKQIHARNRIIKEMKNDISAACWEHEQNKALKIELAAAKRHETYLWELWELCDRLAGYARHSGDCDKSYPAYSALKVKCSCGLDTLLTKDSARGRGEGEK